MRKKVLDFIGGTLMMLAFLSMFGSVGAFETESIGAGQCVVQFGVAMLAAIALGVFNAILMDAAEGYHVH